MSIPTHVIADAGLLNHAMATRAGTVFDDHYFSRLLKSPTELVRAIAYVLGNHEHHFGTASSAYTSAELSQAERAELLSFPVGWLLSVGRFKASPAG